MAAVSGPVIHQDRGHAMKTNNPLTSVANKPGRRPVRVRLRRVNANLAKAYPPDGENQVWWTRLKQALGTTSSDFGLGGGHGTERRVAALGSAAARLLRAYCLNGCQGPRAIEDSSRHHGFCLSCAGVCPLGRCTRYAPYRT
jgi:hypothetical protein